MELDDCFANVQCVSSPHCSVTVADLFYMNETCLAVNSCRIKT